MPLRKEERSKMRKDTATFDSHGHFFRDAFGRRNSSNRKACVIRCHMYSKARTRMWSMESSVRSGWKWNRYEIIWWATCWVGSFYLPNPFVDGHLQLSSSADLAIPWPNSCRSCSLYLSCQHIVDDGFKSLSRVGVALVRAWRSEHKESVKLPSQLKRPAYGF